MKNYKLLLATTAILSMGAMTANADELSWSNYSNAGVSIPLNVRVVKPIKVAVERGIDFGTIEYDENDKTKYITIDKDGNVGGTAQYFGGAHTGLIWYRNFNELDGVHLKLEIPEEPVQLYANGVITAGKECGTVSNFEQKRGSDPEEFGEEGQTFDIPIYIGAKYISSANTMSSSVGTICAGSVTATLVYDIGL